MPEYEIYCSSATGNTKKIADAIAKELWAQVSPITLDTMVEDGKIIFIGTGSYGKKPAAGVVKFVERNDFGGRKVALFGTSTQGDSAALLSLEIMLDGKGADVIGKYCAKGSLLFFIDMGHPNDEEIRQAAVFAKMMKEKYEKRAL